MIIEGIINNNVVSSKDDNGREVVVMGRGIGFGRKKGDALPQEGIDKIFTVGDEESLRKFKDRNHFLCEGKAGRRTASQYLPDAN